MAWPAGVSAPTAQDGSASDGLNVGAAHQHLEDDGRQVGKGAQEPLLG